MQRSLSRGYRGIERVKGVSRAEIADVAVTSTFSLAISSFFRSTRHINHLIFQSNRVRVSYQSIPRVKMGKLAAIRRWFRKPREESAEQAQDLESSVSESPHLTQGEEIPIEQASPGPQPCLAETEPFQQQPTSKVLSLPPELRNEIYRYVLVKEPGRRIILTPGRPSQPALLCTSRQLRKEAIGIFFSENHFTIPVIDYDLRPCIFIRTLNDKYRAEGIRNCRYPSHGYTNWDNLLASLEVLHANPLPAHGRKPKWCTRYEAVSRGVNIVERYRFTPWIRVEEVLEGLS